VSNGQNAISHNSRYCAKNQFPQEDLQLATRDLGDALRRREKYMEISHQSFPEVTKKYINDDYSEFDEGDAGYINSPSENESKFSVVHFLKIHYINVVFREF